MAFIIWPSGGNQQHYSLVSLTVSIDSLFNSPSSSQSQVLNLLSKSSFSLRTLSLFRRKVGATAQDLEQSETLHVIKT